MTIDISADGLQSPAELPNDFPDDVGFLLVIKLFNVDRILLGQAGRLFGMRCVKFPVSACRDEVPVLGLNHKDIAEKFAWCWRNPQ